MTNVPAPFVPLVNAAAAGTGLSPQLVAAQANMESGFNPRATSPTGAQGWLQFEPSTWASQHVPGSPYDPKAATQGYIKLMSSLLHQYGGNVRNALAAYNAGPGNLAAGYGYADKIMSAAGASGSTGMSAKPSRSATFTIPGANVQSQIGGGVNIKALGEAILKRAAATPINTTGKVTAGPNLLGDFVSAKNSGLFNAPVQNVTNKLPDMHGSLRTTGDIAIAGHGDNVNPIDQADGWQYGRTDQGVDASAHVGAPIRAINTSRVVEVVPNWYHGQPLILFQLTAGPDAGKYWYASEQITSHVHVGQTVPRGAVIASYAPTGTGIEIGWGDPHSAGRTLAQATGGYTEGQVTPAGQDFRRSIIHA